MAGLRREQRLPMSMNEEDTYASHSHASSGNIKNRYDSYKASSRSITSTTNRTASFESRILSSLRPAPRSRRTLRPQPRRLSVETKAYPLPDPSQFESGKVSSLSLDTSDDILHPLQSLMRVTQQEKESIRARKEFECRSPQQTLSPVRESADPTVINEQQHSSISDNLRMDKIQKSFVGNFANTEPEKLHQEALEDDTEEEARMGLDIALARVANKVVIVCNGEKKFVVAPVDIAINDYATSEGDAIVVLAYLQHVMSPMGMKMVAAVSKFSGVNEGCLKLAISQKKDEIEYKLQRSGCSQICQNRKIQLEVKVLPGANPKAVVVQEIQSLQGTCAIFERNAMTDKKYYATHLACHLLRLRSDGHRLETISLFGHGLQKSGSMTSLCSETSSATSRSSRFSAYSSSIWSKIKSFGSWRYSAPHQSHGRPDSILNSSSTSSNLGSPTTAVLHQSLIKPEKLDASFSFDHPRLKKIDPYMYVATGLDVCGPDVRNRTEAVHCSQLEHKTMSEWH